MHIDNSLMIIKNLAMQFIDNSINQNKSIIYATISTLNLYNITASNFSINMIYSYNTKLFINNSKFENAINEN